MKKAAVATLCFDNTNYTPIESLFFQIFLPRNESAVDF